MYARGCMYMQWEDASNGLGDALIPRLLAIGLMSLLAPRLRPCEGPRSLGSTALSDLPRFYINQKHSIHHQKKGD